MANRRSTPRPSPPRTSPSRVRALAASVGGLFVVQAAAEQCGKEIYDPFQYTCYDGLLCPVIQDQATLRCADACYLPSQYACTDGSLLSLPEPQQGPFSLTVFSSSSPVLVGLPVNACGQAFELGGQACTYCPEFASASGACGSVTNTTVLDPGSALAVLVPGGQQYYVNPSGALRFTQAHSTSYPPNSTFGIAAYQGGLFVAPGDGWWACPSADDASTLQLFARLEGLVFPATCLEVSIAVKGLPSDTFGAWQYV